MTRKSLKVIFLQLICPVTQKQKLKSKKVQEWNPPKISQIIKRNHKKHNFFFIFFKIYFLPLGQKIFRLQSCGNLHWYRYPLTFKKKKNCKIPRGERFCYASPRSMKLFFLHFQLLCFCCNISLHSLYQIFTVISYTNLMFKERNKK